MNLLRSAAIFLFLLGRSFCMADEIGHEEVTRFMKLAETTADSKTAGDFNVRMRTLLKEVGKLGPEKQKGLYDEVRAINLAGKGWEFATTSENFLIGAILDKTKDNELVVTILKFTPPSNVGLTSLDQYLSECPVHIISRVIMDSAKNNVVAEAAANK